MEKIPSRPPAAAPPTVLLVDDVPENLAVLFEVLSGDGLEVLVAENGEQVLARLPEMRPDLILLDVRMPGMDGFEVCRRLRQMPAFAEVPVIFMTALNETVDKVEGFRAGAVDYVTKPFEAEEVLARVRAHLQLRALRRELERRNRALAREVERRRAAERQLEESLDQAILVATGEGRIQFCTRRGWDLLGRHFELPENGFLPDELVDWLGWAGRDPFIVERPEGQLLVRCFAEAGTRDDSCMLRLDEHLAITSPEPLQALGLTRREAEVLFWLTQGKTSPEIAMILAAAPNTVKKHAQNIFQKLGVDNRTAAALKAWEVLSGSPG
jgi:CheY-like chemotaxis protein/DNA-binding CsgD family transcriptional regulator